VISDRGWYAAKHNLGAGIAYNDTSVVAHFLFIPACVWELGNELTDPVITGILALSSNKQGKTHLVDVGYNRQAHQRLCCHEKQQGKHLSLWQRVRLRSFPKKRSTLVILFNEVLR
jgi:hypothetical protein